MPCKSTYARACGEPCDNRIESYETKRRRSVTSTADLFAAVQGLLGARVAARMLATAAGEPILALCAADAACVRGRASVILPVLDEAERVAPALESLCAQAPTLTEILVVDGGSQDDTRTIVRSFAARDTRIKLVDAGEPPAGWNGKAWNLSCGLATSDPGAEWIVTVDADVRLELTAIASLVAFATSAYLDACSAAPRLELSGACEAALHPALLATFVYRFGLPGHVATTPGQVQANGQFFIARRETLVASRAIDRARASRCEDATIARDLVRDGYRVGFFEGAALARVRMYESAAECLENWPRSLALRDASSEPAELALSLLELALVQALPLWCALGAAVAGNTSSFFFRVNAGLALARFGVLAGTHRAYDSPAWTYWAAPLADALAVAAIVRATYRKRATWRGREMVRI